MITVIDGVKVKLPRKLEPRMVEIAELVDMVKRLARKRNKTVNCIHVWENRRHELCFADFTQKPVREDITLDLRYVCDKCLCKECVRKNRNCFPCKSCNNVPKLTCTMSRRFDPNLVKTAEILAKKKECLQTKIEAKCKCDCNNCELKVTNGELLSAVGVSQTLINNVHHYVVVERFEEKLVYETTVDYPEKGGE